MLPGSLLPPAAARAAAPPGAAAAGQASRRRVKGRGAAEQRLALAQLGHWRLSDARWFMLDNDVLALVGARVVDGHIFDPEKLQAHTHYYWIHDSAGGEHCHQTVTYTKRNAKTKRKATTM